MTIQAIEQFADTNPVLFTVLIIIGFLAAIDWLFLPSKIAKVANELEKIRELLEERKL